MTQRPLLIFITFASFAACGEVSELGSGTDPDSVEGGAGGGEGTGLSAGGAESESGRATFAVSGGSSQGGTGARAGGSFGGHAGTGAPTGGTIGVSGYGGGWAGSAAGAWNAGSRSGGRGGTGFAGGAGAPSCGVDGWNLVIGDDLPVISWPVSDEDCATQGTQLLAERERAHTGKALSVAPLAGTWADGSGDERVELRLDAKGSGTIIWAEPADAEPIDPSLPAPGETPDPAWRALPGFRYTVVPQTGRASEMSFRILFLEPWSEWCSLQAPVRSAACYSCDHNLGSWYSVGSECGEREGCYTGNRDLSIEVNCERAERCSSFGVCACTQQECFANFEPTITFNLTLDPVDTSVLRLVSLNDASKPTRYLVREE